MEAVASRHVLLHCAAVSSAKRDANAARTAASVLKSVAERRPPLYIARVQNWQELNTKVLLEMEKMRDMDWTVNTPL